MKETEKEYSNGATQSSVKVSELGFVTSRESIYLTRLPIPPSSNNQYSLFRRGNKTYLVPSKEYLKYKKDMNEYFLAIGIGNLENIRAKALKWAEQKRWMHVEAVFSFKKERLFTKKNQPKKLDTSNRIKALHDQISQYLGIDDSWFFSLTAAKTEAISEEMVSVEILPHM